MIAYTLPIESCLRCDRPSVQAVGRKDYCHEHALAALWKMHTPRWREMRSSQRRRLDENRH